MDWQTIVGTAGGALAGIGTTGAAWLESKRRRRREEQIQESAEHKQAVDERSDILKVINEQLLEPLKTELGEVRERLKVAEDKIDHLEDTNDRLVAFIYRLIALTRKHGVDSEILPADVPPGIHL